jgi:biopolymer transport protein ExbB
MSILRWPMFAALLMCLSSLSNASDNMADVLKNVKSSLEQHQSQEDLRLADFVKSGVDRQLQLQMLRDQILLKKQLQQQLLTEFTVLNEQNLEKSEELVQRSTQLTALFSFAKKYAKQVSEKIDNSFSRARFPDHQQSLAFANSEDVPQLQDLKMLWLVLMQEMTAKAGISRFDGEVIDEKGQTVATQIVQIGAFNAIDAQGNYLAPHASTGLLQVRISVNEALKQQARAFVSGTSSQLIIDPLKGQLLDQQSRTPDLRQRIEQGGLVGYIILGLGALGAMIALWRVLYMSWVSRKIKRALKQQNMASNNPLSRVLKAVAGVESVERAELLIDKAMLSEIPKLERCHSLVKLLAAVAPLLGLLGTVTGMIETFQSITLLGTSDPKLMAGGISQALITTVMGLCVAIPLLFCHSFISSKSQAILQLIQQQSLGRLSEYFADIKASNERGSKTSDTALAAGTEKANENLTLEGAALA